MPPELTPPTPADLAAKRGARVALAGFLVLSSYFALSSAWQVTRAALFAGDEGATPSPRLDARGECGRSLKRLVASVEHGLAVSGNASTEASAVASFEAGIAVDWGHADRIAEVCRSEPRGTDAFAAIDRLRRAAEAVAGHRASDLASARRDVTAMLGP